MKFFPIAMALAVVACAPPAQKSAAPLPCPAAGLPEEAPPAGLVGPTVRSLPILPMPVPSWERGRRVTIRLVIDTAGKAMRDSITICGIRDSRYAELAAEKMLGLSFSPARRDGQAVVWPTRFVVQLAPIGRERKPKPI